MKCDDNAQSKCGGSVWRPLLTLGGIILLIWIVLRVLDLLRSEEIDEVIIFPPQPEAAPPPDAFQDLPEEEDVVVATDVAAEVSPDDLTRINGVGPVYARQLQAGGIVTFAQLAALTPEQLDDIIDAPDWREPDYQSWIHQARNLSET